MLCIIELNNFFLFFSFIGKEKQGILIGRHFKNINNTLLLSNSRIAENQQLKLLFQESESSN